LLEKYKAFYLHPELKIMIITDGFWYPLRALTFLPKSILAIEGREFSILKLMNEYEVQI